MAGYPIPPLPQASRPRTGYGFAGAVAGVQFYQPLLRRLCAVDHRGSDRHRERLGHGENPYQCEGESRDRYSHFFGEKHVDEGV